MIEVKTEWNEDSVRVEDRGRKVESRENCGSSKMPRAFLITRRRYNGTGEFEETGRGECLLCVLIMWCGRRRRKVVILGLGW